MYVAGIDSNFYRDHREIRTMLDQYKLHFGKAFPCFSYALFQGTKEKCTMQIYKETLEKALREDKPFEYPPDYKFDY